MKSIALTLAVLFGTLSFAQATTETPVQNSEEAAVLQNASGEPTGEASESAESSETKEQTN